MTSHDTANNGFQDFSGENDSDYAITNEIPSDSSTTDDASSPRAPSGDPARFPAKLHRMLTSVAKEGLDDIVSWQPHGRCFLIRNKAQFIEKVMPKWFYQLKFVSFQRQLNLFGFKKIYNQGPDKGGIYHPRFLRGMPNLAGSIQRAKTKGSGASQRASKSSECEPDLYSLPFLTEGARSPRGSQQNSPRGSYIGSPVARGVSYGACTDQAAPSEDAKGTSSDMISMPVLRGDDFSLEPRPIGPGTSIPAMQRSVSTDGMTAPAGFSQEEFHALVCHHLQRTDRQQGCQQQSSSVSSSCDIGPGANIAQPASMGNNARLFMDFSSYPEASQIAGLFSSGGQQAYHGDLDMEPTPFKPGTSAKVTTVAEGWQLQQQRQLQQQLQLFERQQLRQAMMPQDHSQSFGVGS